MFIVIKVSVVEIYRIVSRSIIRNQFSVPFRPYASGTKGDLIFNSIRRILPARTSRSLPIQLLESRYRSVPLFRILESWFRPIPFQLLESWFCNTDWNHGFIRFRSSYWNLDTIPFRSCHLCLGSVDIYLHS